MKLGAKLTISDGHRVMKGCYYTRKISIKMRWKCQWRRSKDNKIKQQVDDIKKHLCSCWTTIIVTCCTLTSDIVEIGKFIKHKGPFDFYVTSLDELELFYFKDVRNVKNVI